ncbi:MAG: pyridoxine 5'-phosphate synthase [Holophaga sp.]|nr:pyridoxine 5'-phosphate synthase [Holophaga sp.]
MAKLSVNVNKIATLRNSRGGGTPDLMTFVGHILGFGAQGITVHPRADCRHITPEDARAVARGVKTVETNFEGDVRESFLDLVLECKPTQCTLVPVQPGEVTSNHGWAVSHWAYLLAPVVARLKEEGIRISLFVEPGDVGSVRAAASIGADRIEIYTEPYATAFDRDDPEAELDRVLRSAEAAEQCGLQVNAGHDLTHLNLPLLVRRVPNLAEVSIGHHLISHALLVGMEQSVHDYLTAAQG